MWDEYCSAFDDSVILSRSIVIFNISTYIASKILSQNRVIKDIIAMGIVQRHVLDNHRAVHDARTIDTRRDSQLDTNVACST